MFLICKTHELHMPMLKVEFRRGRALELGSRVCCEPPGGGQGASLLILDFLRKTGYLKNSNHLVIIRFAEKLELSYENASYSKT